jgi:hypothetical protein
MEATLRNRENRECTKKAKVLWRSFSLRGRKKCLTWVKKAFRFHLHHLEKGIFTIMKQVGNNIIVIISAVGVVLSLLLLLVGVIDLRRQGLVVT